MEKQRKRLKRQHDATQYREALAAAWDEADQMATAQLWWISRDMAKLAADTAAVGDYPKNHPPAASGVMIIDGGLPISGFSFDNCDILANFVSISTSISVYS